MEPTKKIHQVREAVKDDCHQIIKLIKMLARSHNMEDEVKIDAETLIRDGFTENKVASFKCLVSHDESQQLSGYLIYCYTYSTWEGQSILMNIFDEPLSRKLGIGKNMITKLAHIACAENIGRIDFSIMDWNQLSIDFHQSLGAINTTKKEGWNIFRFDKNTIQQLANKVIEVKKINEEIHQVREAVVDDCHQILELIKMLARYHNMEDEVKIDAETLIRDGFRENKVPTFKCLISCGSQCISGFLTYYYTYSPYEGRCIYMEDIFVGHRFRKMRIGKNMITKLAQIAHAENIACIDFSVADWNRSSIDFLQSLGAVNLKNKVGLNMFKFDKNSIEKLATNREMIFEKLAESPKKNPQITREAHKLINR